MIQRFYRSHILQRFMSADELAEFDQKYQSVKNYTANNLGQETFNQLVAKAVKEELAKKEKLPF